MLYTEFKKDQCDHCQEPDRTCVWIVSFDEDTPENSTVTVICNLCLLAFVYNMLTTDNETADAVHTLAAALRKVNESND